MKRLLSINYNPTAFNVAMLGLRVIFGLLMLLLHGLDKLQKFSTLQGNFYNFMGLGPKTSLVMSIFAELFCSLFLILGLFTRFTVSVLIINMLVIILLHDSGKGWLESEVALMYLFAYLAILLCGPGKISVDGMMNK